MPFNETECSIFESSLKKAGRTAILFAPYQAVWCSHGSLGGQDSSAFCTAAGKNLAAVGGCHSLAETMDLRAMTLSGLIGTQHWVTPPVRLCSTVKRPQQSKFCIVMQMVLYRKNRWKVNRNLRFFRKISKLVSAAEKIYKIWISRRKKFMFFRQSWGFATKAAKNS